MVKLTCPRGEMAVELTCPRCIADVGSYPVPPGDTGGLHYRCWHCGWQGTPNRLFVPEPLRFAERWVAHVV